MHRRGNDVSVSKGARLPKTKKQNHFKVSALSRNTKSMGDAMTELLALSVSVAVLGGIWAFIALGASGRLRSRLGWVYRRRLLLCRGW